MERLLDVNELSEMLGVTKATIYSRTFQNKIPHIKLSKRLLRFREEDIRNWIASKAVNTDSTQPRPENGKRKRLKTNHNLSDNFIEKIVRDAKKEVLS